MAPYRMSLYSIPASSSHVHWGLQGVAVLQWVFSFLGLGEAQHLALCFLVTRREAGQGSLGAAEGMRRNFLGQEGPKPWNGGGGVGCNWELKCLGPEYPPLYPPAQVCLALLFLALLSRARVLAILHLVWFYRDRDTLRAGGRRSACVCSWAIWRHFRDYFPVSVRPSRNGVLGGGKALE